MTNFSEFGYVNVSWNNSTKDAAWYAWRVYRRMANPTGAWELLAELTDDQTVYNYHDWLARSGHTYQYSVVQVAYRFDQVVESQYLASAQYTPVDSSYWLINPDDETMNVRLHVNSDDFDEEIEEATINLIGRGRRKEYGTNYGYRGTIAGTIRRDIYLTPSQQRARLESMRQSLASFYLRTPFGDVWKVTSGELKLSRVAGVGSEEMMNFTFDYQEVI